jgi:pimeloyl-ACP methyl ester carboxylesterase
MTSLEINHSQNQPFPKGATAILVHGAWADGSSWAHVVGPLLKQGLGVICAQLPLTSLSDDVAALGRFIERTEGPVVLVAHAYAGAVIAAVSHERVKSLVFITALAPDEGETVADVFYREDPHTDAPALAPDAHGFIWMPGESFAKAFAQNASADENNLLNAVQRPISVACIQERVPLPAWKSKPSWYLVAEQDHMITPKTQRYMAEHMGAHVVSYPVDHLPLLTAPDVVVDTILAAARASLFIS